MHLMRKEILFSIIMIAVIAVVLLFMAQNTRYESNSIVCSHPKNVFEVTYSQLENGAQLSFEKNNEVLKTYEINSLEGSMFQFDGEFSNYAFDLSKNISIETRQNEIILYECEHKKFKI